MAVGVYSDQDIKQLIASGAINVGGTDPDSSQFQPSSFDLRVGGHFYCLSLIHI